LEKQMREAAGNLEFETAARLRDELKRLTATELAISDDPFARQSAVDRAVDDAFLSAVRDGAEDGGKAARGKGSRKRMQRASRPGVPKTFGSRSR
jgi:excinuclease ABC subunit B